MPLEFPQPISRFFTAWNLLGLEVTRWDFLTFCLGTRILFILFYFFLYHPSLGNLK